MDNKNWETPKLKARDMYINVLHIEPITKILYCTDAFGLNTEFKFDELVKIH
ncbi:hypothetical protein V8U20_004465 [Bacillus cereus]